MTIVPEIGIDLTAEERAWLDGFVERPCQMLDIHGDAVDPCEATADAIAVYCACVCGDKRRSMLVCAEHREAGWARCKPPSCRILRAAVYVERLR